jgi:hypothetical protein
VVARHRSGPDGTELGLHEFPELGQSHPATVDGTLIR